jgi:pilus assembly protein Flp/PilA
MRPLLFRFFADRRGATAVEYGLLVGIIGVTLAVALGNYYEVMHEMFNTIASTYEGAASPTAAQPL